MAIIKSVVNSSCAAADDGVIDVEIFNVIAIVIVIDAKVIDNMLLHRYYIVRVIHFVKKPQNKLNVHCSIFFKFNFGLYI